MKSNIFKMEALTRSFAGWAAIMAILALVGASGCEKGGSSPVFMQKSEGEHTGSDFVVPKPEDIIEDPDTGLMVIRGVLNIHFSPKLSREEAEKIIAASGGQIAGYDYSVNFFQAKYPLEGEALEKKILELLTRKGVETVAKTSVSVHKDPYYAK